MSEFKAGGKVTWREAELRATMRSWEKIQEAHDILSGIVDGEASRIILSKKSKRRLGNMAGVLCWVLGHPEGIGFEKLLSDIKEEMANLGYSFETRPETPDIGTAADTMGLTRVGSLIAALVGISARMREGNENQKAAEEEARKITEMDAREAEAREAGAPLDEVDEFLKREAGEPGPIADYIDQNTEDTDDADGPGNVPF